MKLVCRFQCTGMAASGLGLIGSKGSLKFGALSPKTRVISYTFYPRTPIVWYFRLEGKVRLSQASTENGFSGKPKMS